MTGFYEPIFREAEPNYDAKEIEEIVRLRHPTLDHMTRAELVEEAHLAAQVLALEAP